jgi:MOSC domain-containing protein YiiM
VYLDLQVANGFAENALVGHRVRIGPKVVVFGLERDPRCKMITLDRDTAMPNPEVLRRVTRDHDRTAGIYGAVLEEGVIGAGDPVEVLD